MKKRWLMLLGLAGVGYILYRGAQRAKSQAAAGALSSATDVALNSGNALYDFADKIMTIFGE